MFLLFPNSFLFLLTHPTLCSLKKKRNKNPTKMKNQSNQANIIIFFKKPKQSKMKQKKITKIHEFVL